ESFQFLDTLSRWRDKSAMHSSLLIGLGLLALAIPQNATQDNAERPPEVQQLITSLPECSRLRRDLEEGRYSDQTELPYMQAMHKEGVQRDFLSSRALCSRATLITSRS